MKSKQKNQLQQNPNFSNHNLQTFGFDKRAATRKYNFHKTE